MYPDLVKIVLLILSLFMIGALIIFSAKHLRRSNQELLAELWKLYGIEFFIVAAVLIPAYFGGVIFIIALLLFNLRAHVEIAQLHGYAQKTNIITAGILFSSVVIIAESYILPQGFLVYYFISLTAFFVFLILYVMAGKKHHVIASALLPMIIFLLSISCLLHIRSMETGFLLIIFLYLVTETNDAFAMIAGKLIGRTRLYPRISPNKTWEGMVSGVVVSMLVGLGYSSYILDYSFSEASIIIGLIITGAIIGDMIFSVYKRAYNTKDFMTLIKGHGGIIDIYDSLLVSSITFYVLILLTGLSSSL